MKVKAEVAAFPHLLRISRRSPNGVEERSRALRLGNVHLDPRQLSDFWECGEQTHSSEARILRRVH